MTATADARQRRTAPPAGDASRPRRPADAERICRAAVAAARTARSRPVPPAGRVWRPARRARARLRVTTGACLAATGAALWLGVHGRPGGVAVQTTGFVLMLAGLAWLLAHVRGKRQRLSRALDLAIDYLSVDPGAAASVRCPLDELLEPAATDRAGKERAG